MESNENGKKLKESDGDFNGGSHKVISADKIMFTNSSDIKQLIDVIAQKYKIGKEDAAFALTRVFEKLSS